MRKSPAAECSRALRFRNFGVSLLLRHILRDGLGFLRRYVAGDRGGVFLRKLKLWLFGWRGRDSSKVLKGLFVYFDLQLFTKSLRSSSI